jgi:hypothetical protein
VQALLSSQLPSVALFWQAPAMQVSAVHGLESSQSLFARQTQAEVSCWQTPAAQVSMLQAMLSSQFIGVPLHESAEHVSPVVQALLSLQERVFAVCLQPVFLSHESVVQALLSLQETIM